MTPLNHNKSSKTSLLNTLQTAPYAGCWTEKNDMSPSILGAGKTLFLCSFIRQIDSCDILICRTFKFY